MHPNSWAPGRLPLHTLVPAIAMTDGRPSLVFGTMGADAQAQVHVQLLTHLFDDRLGLQTALDLPRWRVEPGTWRVRAERGAVDAAAMRAMGHDIDEVAAPDEGMGHAHLISLDAKGTISGVASDPRAEGLALQLR
jgi:gamma-glutamyltranspeptidase/glutathione hydrolase